jgi:hypothetical protein
VIVHRHLAEPHPWHVAAEDAADLNRHGLGMVDIDTSDDERRNERFLGTSTHAKVEVEEIGKLRDHLKGSSDPTGGNLAVRGTMPDDLELC